MSPDPDLDRLLPTALRSGRAADDCPDAEQLAAFAERTLAAREADAVERHASNCARCTAVLSTLIDAEPAAAAAPVITWRSWHAWRWLAPAATAVLVAGLWFSLRAPSDAVRDEKPVVVASRDVGGSPIDRLNDGRLSGQDERAPSAPPLETTRSAEAKRDDASSRKTASGQAVPQQGGDEKDRLAQFARVPSGDTGARQSAQAAGGGTPANGPVTLSESVASEERLQKAEAAVRPPSPAAAPAAAANETVLRDAASSRAAAEEPGVARRNEGALAAPVASAAPAGAAAASPPPPAAVGAPPSGFGGLVGGAPAGGGGRGGRGGGRAAQAVGPPIVLTGGSGQAQWRISGLGVERSDNGGATWTPVYQASRALSGGAIAPDDTIWIVGQAGLVLRGTPSGWTVVSPPVSTDLASVAAVSTRGATVRTRDGRDFRTEDAGASWQQQ